MSIKLKSHQQNQEVSVCLFSKGIYSDLGVQKIDPVDHKVDAVSIIHTPHLQTFVKLELSENAMSHPIQTMINPHIPG